MENEKKSTETKEMQQLDNHTNGLLIFARAISMLLEPNTGIVVDLKGEMRNPSGTSDKVIVMNIGNERTMIDTFNEDFPPGSICKIEYNTDTIPEENKSDEAVEPDAKDDASV